MNIQIKNDSKTRKMVIEMNADKFEKMAANFGFFSNDFYKSVEKAEKDYKTGKTRKIKSLSFLK